MPPTCNRNAWMDRTPQIARPKQALAPYNVVLEPPERPSHLSVETTDARQCFRCNRPGNSLDARVEVWVFLQFVPNRGQHHDRSVAGEPQDRCRRAGITTRGSWDSDTRPFRPLKMDLSLFLQDAELPAFPATEGSGFPQRRWELSRERRADPRSGGCRS